MSNATDCDDLLVIILGLLPISQQNRTSKCLETTKGTIMHGTTPTIVYISRAQGTHTPCFVKLKLRWECDYIALDRHDTRDFLLYCVKAQNVVLYTSRMCRTDPSTATGHQHVAASRCTGPEPRNRNASISRCFPRGLYVCEGTRRGHLSYRNQLDQRQRRDIEI